MFAGQSAASVGCHGTPTVTSQNGTPGTGIVSTLNQSLITPAYSRLSQVWLSDSSKGLIAFNAVPTGNVLTQLTVPGSGGLTKFHRPVFGNNKGRTLLGLLKSFLIPYFPEARNISLASAMVSTGSAFYRKEFTDISGCSLRDDKQPSHRHWWYPTISSTIYSSRISGRRSVILNYGFWQLR